MTHDELVSLFLALGVLLATARLLGELALKLNQPAVLGELVAGIVLGPTVLGALAPAAHARLFPAHGSSPIVLQGFTTVAIALFLLVAGLEVDLSTVFRRGKAALFVSIGGLLLPFALGFALAWGGLAAFSPEALGWTERGDSAVFALFLAAAMSISALPVIAKTLMDLRLYRSDLGMTVIASAVLNDLLGWVMFAIVLRLIGVRPTEGGLGTTIALTLGFVALMLTVGRWLSHRLLPIVQAHASWPGGLLGLTVALALLGGALTESIGLHAMFGTFMVGVTLGDSRHLRERTRQTLAQFITFIFAPLFFASVGLHVDFAAHFDLGLTLAVILVASIGKMLGCGLAARLANLPWAESWAIGAAMNARGAMEIILALMAMQAGLIAERLFVALVVMALATSVIAGPLMQRMLRLGRPRRLTDFVGAKSFVPALSAATRFDAISELCAVIPIDGASRERVLAAVLERERSIATGVGHGIALPHARVPGLASPQVAIGLSAPGVDFDAPDGQPAHVVCLIVVGEDEHALLLQLYQEIVQRLSNDSVREELFRVRTHSELRSLLTAST